MRNGAKIRKNYLLNIPRVLVDAHRLSSIVHESRIDVCNCSLKDQEVKYYIYAVLDTCHSRTRERVLDVYLVVVGARHVSSMGAVLARCDCALYFLRKVE